jgi:small subunit ribosomal protein S17
MRNIGIPVAPPKRSCDDKDCPFHGTLSIRGRLLQGKVVSIRANKMAVIEREYYHYVKKYLRYEKRKSKIHAHLPPCLDVNVNDTVTIAECKPLSKTVSFVIIEKR